MPDIYYDDSYKEVYFGEYCKTCKHEKKAETEKPCRHCLDNPVNQYTHKPVDYDPIVKKKGEKK